MEIDSARNIPDELLCDPTDEAVTPPWLNVADHIFAVDEKGGFVDAPVNGDEPEGRSFQAQISAVFESYLRHRQSASAAATANQILVFVNGGLNSMATSVSRAREQVPCMLRAGYFPIFLVWHSSFIDAYWEQIGMVRNGRLYREPRLTAPIYLLADIGQGVARAPATYLSGLGRFLDTLEMSLRDLDETDRGLPAPVPELQVRYDGPNQTLERFVPNAIRFGLTAPVKFLTTPFVDAFGHTAWENMLRRTRTTLRKPSEFDPLNRDPLEIERYPKGTGGFSKFFAELEFCARGQDRCIVPSMATELSSAEITVIGHSMGATILDEILRLYDELPYRNVIYMGAANSIRRFLENVVPVMESHPDLKFYNLSLHPVADAREVNVQGLIPNGSLLEWVDDMYAQPATMLDRTLGKWINVSTAAHVFPAHLRNRMFFRVFGFREADASIHDPGDPTAHGELNDTEMHYWLPDFWGRADAWPSRAGKTSQSGTRLLEQLVPKNLEMQTMRVSYVGGADRAGAWPDTRR